ncbi:MAG: hypothetical protein KDJ65_38735, partial [Anaerolineae bacterium]|nr:hypothetical protein [Anaerolineae bacterium]
MTPQWLKSRNVIERVYIAGMLTLTTPAHFGNGDTDSLTDIPLLRDSVDPTRPLLTGASIAGALRNYLREWQLGYGRAEQQNGQTWAEKLFGHLDEPNEATVESWLMVDDALGLPPEKGASIEIRDGVTIDPKTRTAEDGKKYDIELLAAGTRFPLHFELWLTEEQKNEGLLDALVLALQGFEAAEPGSSGEIRLGMRKRRGFGRCRVAGWQIKRFEMTSPAKIVDWLNYDFPSEQELSAYTDTLPESTTLITDE